MGVHCGYTDEWYDGRLSLAGCLGVLSGNMVPEAPLGYIVGAVA